MGPGQARSSYATAINKHGDVVGQSFDHPDDDAPHQHAMLWTGAGTGSVTARDLHVDFDNEFLNSVANGINDSGQVVGQAYDGMRERAFVWEDVNGVGTVTILDDVGPGFSSFAHAINNASPAQITGGAHDQSGDSRRGLLWTVGGGTPVELPVPARVGPGWPAGLNEIGEVVGKTSPTKGNEDIHAILWTFDPKTGDRIAVDLGVGLAKAIGNSAPGLTRVVGSTTITSGKGRNKTKDTRAFVWEVRPSS